MLPSYYPYLSQYSLVTVLSGIIIHMIWLVTTAHLNDSTADNHSFSLFCFIIWFIWKTRNAAVFRQEIINAEDIMTLAYKAYDEFLSFPQNSNTNVPSSSPTTHMPVPAYMYSSDYIKINVDAATDQTHRSIWDPGILKFLAVREALNWAIACKWHSVLTEGDALQIIQSLNSHDIHIASVWGICSDIWHLQSSFISCNFVHISRVFNLLAHKLANFCKLSLTPV
ncbi:uncharacterized protein LOC126668726 [Mercurialis annua]|uniref:uncharacterized protein LOC126668726 n=1 Tax=Mercurialis annua TaxID=3986 RepID=UPI0024ACDE4F|nr:uncharacterized protein LOC126668726 [Mercurialis annua]